MGRISVVVAAALALAACTPESTPEPTPTKTPEPSPTAVTPAPEALLPSLDTLPGVALQQADLAGGFTPNPDNTGPLTPEIIAENSSAVTAEFVLRLDDLYGYQTAFVRAESVETFAAVISWVVVFGNAEQASAFLELHPTLIAGEAGFRTLEMPAFGEESAAYAATSSSAESVVPLDRHDVVMRVGNLAAVLTVVTASGLGDVDEIEEYAGLLADRLGTLR